MNCGHELHAFVERNVQAESRFVGLWSLAWLCQHMVDHQMAELMRQHWWLFSNEAAQSLLAPFQALSSASRPSRWQRTRSVMSAAKVRASACIKLYQSHYFNCLAPPCPPVRFPHLPLLLMANLCDFFGLIFISCSGPCSVLLNRGWLVAVCDIHHSVCAALV